MNLNDFRKNLDADVNKILKKFPQEDRSKYKKTDYRIYGKKRTEFADYEPTGKIIKPSTRKWLYND